MILEFLLNILFSLINSIISIVPDFAFSTEGISSAFSVGIQLLNAVGFFFPLDTLMHCLTVILGFYTFQFFASFFNWSIRKIPTIS